MTEWKQERPSWCPHTDCVFRRRSQDVVCCGVLPEPVPHGADANTYRLCLNGAADDGGVFDLQVNDTDLGWFRWHFDALDGKSTSWLSARAEPEGKEPPHPVDWAAYNEWLETREPEGERIEGVAFKDGDRFCPDCSEAGSAASDSYVFVPNCEHYEADEVLGQGERRAILILPTDTGESG